MYNRWRGWPRHETPPLRPGGGPWLDLSHPLREDMARIAFFPQPRIRRIMSMPEKPLNVTEIQVACHVGTHVDAPLHFVPDGPAFHEIPLDRLYGPGVVWRLDVPRNGLITPSDLERMEPELRPGDIVFLDTGWAQYFGDPVYDEHPALTPEAAEWLVARGVKMVGVDFATPDLPVPRRPPDFDWPVHHVLLSQGVLVVEHLTNLRPLAGRRVEVMCLALNIQGADGAPARVVARPAETQDSDRCAMGRDCS